MRVDTSGRWVDVVFVQDTHEHDDFDFDEASFDEVIEYLTQWDFGDETDAAHTMDEWSAGSSDDVYVSDNPALSDYVLTYNLRLGYYGLVRRPFEDVEGPWPS